MEGLHRTIIGDNGAGSGKWKGYGRVMCRNNQIGCELPVTTEKEGRITSNSAASHFSGQMYQICMSINCDNSDETSDEIAMRQDSKASADVTTTTGYICVHANKKQVMRV